MKKPADSKRDNPEGPELDEFSKLQQQYDEASAEERERLWPDLIRAIRKIDPSFLQKFERAFRSGDYLKATGRERDETSPRQGGSQTGRKDKRRGRGDCRSLHLQ